MQISQSLSSSKRYLYSPFPRKRWESFIEEMIFQAFVRHELIYKEPLDPSFSIYSTVSNKFDKVWVLHNPEKMYFCHPLLMPLHEKDKQSSETTKDQKKKAYCEIALSKQEFCSTYNAEILT